MLKLRAAHAEMWIREEALRRAALLLSGLA